MINLFLRNFVVAFILLFLSSSCVRNSECPECFTPPESLQLRIVGKSASEDLIFNGTYNDDSISIAYLTALGEQSVEYQVYTDSALKQSILVSYQISWESAAGFKEFLLHLNEQETDTIYLNVEEMHTECCTYYDWVNFEINGIEPDYDMENYYYILSK